MRIDIFGTVGEALVAVADGNPGAVVVLMRSLEADPNNVCILFELDTLGIYGAAVWELYKDECNEDLAAFHIEVARRAEAL